MSRAKTQRPVGGRKQTRAGTAAGKRASSFSDLEIEIEEPEPPRAQSVIDDQLVEETELPPLVQLVVAVHESAPFLGAAQGAIVFAGHRVEIAATGREGLDKVRRNLSDVDAVIVGLPGGESVIDAALALAPQRPVVIAACSGDPLDAIGKATAAGADLVTMRPHDVQLVSILLAASRLVTERRQVIASRGSEAVLRSRVEALTESDGAGLQPFELFQRTLELELKRAKRYQYALSVALFALDPQRPAPPAGVAGILRARAGNALIHTIRDIDMATEIDQERFLVLLPYTDHVGAGEVARRVLRAVADEKPVTAAGRTFKPHVTAAVAGAKPGQPVSFARLMKDANEALEVARQGGIELAVSS